MSGSIRVTSMCRRIPAGAKPDVFPGWGEQNVARHGSPRRDDQLGCCSVAPARGSPSRCHGALLADGDPVPATAGLGNKTEHCQPRVSREAPLTATTGAVLPAGLGKAKASARFGSRDVHSIPHSRWRGAEPPFAGGGGGRGEGSLPPIFPARDSAAHPPSNLFIEP